MSISSPSQPDQLQTTERDTTLNPRQLRTAGFIPATLYGKGLASQSIQVRMHAFEVAYSKGGRSFDLGSFGIASVKQIQVDPVSQKVLNIEFYLPQAAGISKNAKAPAALAS